MELRLQILIEMELFKTVGVPAYYIAIWLLKLKYIVTKHIENFSRRHFVNSLQVSEVLGSTVSKTS